MHPPKWNILALFFKKNLYFLKRKLFVYFLIFPDMEPALPTPISPPPLPPKKKTAQKNFLYFRKWNFLALILKKILYFLKRKLFIYFLKRKLFMYFWKWNLAIFSPSLKNKRIHPRKQKTDFSYILGNWNFEP